MYRIVYSSAPWLIACQHLASKKKHRTVSAGVCLSKRTPVYLTLGAPHQGFLYKPPCGYGKQPKCPNQTNKRKLSNNFEVFLIKISSRSQCATWLIARRRLASKKKHVVAHRSMRRRMSKRAHARMLNFKL